MDPKLHDFKSIRTTGAPVEGGDTAFDEEEFPQNAALPGVQVISL